MADTAFLGELDAAVANGWAKIKDKSFWHHVSEHGMDARLYQRVMTEMYHYTRHNSINQAVAAGRCTSPDDLHLLKFCYEHADEELGHEKMIVHDLDRVGLLDPELLAAPPLPPTQALIAYLYFISLTEGARARLGYSYWAESSYDEIGPLLQRARDDLRLDDESMTFFVAHSTVDVKHAEEVRDAILENVTTVDDERAVLRVAETSLYLTGQLMDAALSAHLDASVAAA
jgi:pyrroloquinoline quinone (PQQ) biosynthesis protein C